MLEYVSYFMSYFVCISYSQLLNKRIKLLCGRAFRGGDRWADAGEHLGAGEAPVNKSWPAPKEVRGMNF